MTMMKLLRSYTDEIGLMTLKAVEVVDLAADTPTGREG